jgi:Fe-S cluster assembly protein SufD
LRDRAFATFEEQGVPTRSLENWKGTNFSALDALSIERLAGASVTQATSEFAAAMPQERPNLVFVDGRLDESASRRSDLPPGVRALTLAEAIASEPELVEGRLASLADPKLHSLVALNTAFLEDGLVLVFDSKTEATRPVRLRFIATSDGSGAASATFARLLVVSEERSAASLFLEHDSNGPAPGFTSLVAEFFSSPGSQLEFVQVQAENAERIHFTSVHARLEGDARFDSHVFSLGEGLVRSELSASVVEPGAQLTMCGLFLGREAGHIDHFTTVDHAAPHCTSDQEYRGVLGDRSKGVFRGRVIIRPGADKTATSQSNPNLLISEHATIDTKPQLEIYADDVRASHGSTIGQLDTDALFFLRARGIDLTSARRLLTGAFANAVAERIANPDLRAQVALHIDAALAKLAPEHAAESTATKKDPNR